MTQTPEGKPSAPVEEADRAQDALPYWREILTPLVAVLLGGLTFVWSAYSIAEGRRFAAVAIPTSGTVIAKAAGPDHSVVPTVAYQVHGEHGRRRYSPGFIIRSYHHLQVGDPVTVYYDPSSPMDARLAEDMESMYPLLYAAAGTFFLIAGSLHLRKIRRDQVRQFFFGRDEDAGRA